MGKARSLVRLVAVSLVALAGLLVTEPATAEGYSWGHATLHGGPRFGSDDLNFGAGLNLGYTLDQGVYLGGLFDYFLGETEEFDAPFPVEEVGFDAWFLMFDGGYDFGVAESLVIRPSLALGLATAHGRVCFRAPVDDCETDTESEFEGALSGNLLYLTGSLTLGGELRLFFGEFDGVWMGFNIGTVF